MGENFDPVGGTVDPQDIVHLRHNLHFINYIILTACKSDL